MTVTDSTSSPRAGTAPALSSIHHLGLTVRDAETSAAWYQRVLGLEFWFQESHFNSDAGGYCIILAPPDRSFSLGLDHHPAHADERFDCTRTGLDHLSFQVPNLDTLHAWAAHLDAEGIENSGVYPMEGFPLSLVTFVDPDGIQLEFLAMHG